MEQYNTAKKQYKEYVAKQLKLREENEMWKVGYGMTTGLLEPSAFSNLIAGIQFEEVKQKDFRYNAYKELTSELVDKFIENEIVAPTLTYGTKADDKGVTHNDNVFHMVDGTKFLTLSGFNTQVDNKKGGSVSIDMTQVCPEGVYTFSIGTGENNDFRFNNFRFYSNNEFTYEAQKYGHSLEKIKQRFAAGIGYDIRPTQNWMGGQDNLGNPLTSEYAVNISQEDMYMLANMLFKEGLQDIFKTKKIEIPEEYREYYEEQAQDNGLNVDQAPVINIEEEPTKEEVIEQKVAEEID